MTKHFGRVLVDGQIHYARWENGQVGLLADNFLDNPDAPVTAWWSLEDVTLMPPVAPRTVLAVGRNYAAHAQELGNPVPSEPLFFLKQSGSVVGDGEPVRIPTDMGRMDFEGELVLIMGKKASQLKSLEEAAGTIWGYTIGNDVTARDLQKRDGQWVRAKGYDTFAPMGPWAVTGLDVEDLRLVTTVNQEVRQDGTTLHMIFKPADLVWRASQFMTLEPGDVIYTGTPEGIGPISVGDLVQITIDGIGTLSNLIKTRDS